MDDVEVAGQTLVREEVTEGESGFVGRQFQTLGGVIIDTLLHEVELPQSLPDVARAALVHPEAVALLQ